MTGTGSLQTLTNLSRASSIRSVQSSRNGDLVVAAPGGVTPKVSYTRSNSQVIRPFRFFNFLKNISVFDFISRIGNVIGKPSITAQLF